MPTLELYLLGSPKLLLNANPLRGFATRKTEALLIYLAVNQQIHRRDSLATLFWPEMGEEHTRNNLRRTLSNLRKLVGDHLQIDRYTVSFDTQADYRLDTEEFITLLATSPHAATSVPLRAADLEAALALYRNDFLAGFHVREVPQFEEWVCLQREYFHGLAVQGLERLSTHYLKQHEVEKGLATTARLLGLEPWRELIHQQRMQLFILAGRRIDALAQYDHCRTILAEEFGTEPQRETVELYQQIKAGLIASSRAGGVTQAIAPQATEQTDIADEAVRYTYHNRPATLTGNMPNGAGTGGSGGNGAAAVAAVQIDQGEMPRQASFYGRFRETAQLERWLLIEGCALVTIVGLGGSGKTALAAKITRSLTEIYPDSTRKTAAMHQASSNVVLPFSHIIWRSLLNAPPLETILTQWLEFLSGYQRTALPQTLPEQLTLLFTYLRQQRCLLVLDNLESLLEAEKTVGTFRPGYEDYGLLIQRMGEMEHQSCLLLTSRELPMQAARLERHFPLIRSLVLGGLPAEAGLRILQTAGLEGPVEELHAVAHRYSGNPLALNLIAETIQDFYGGNIAAFLSENPLVFADIRLVLEEQFQRLSLLEQELLFWFAIEREPLTIAQLTQRFVTPPSTWLLLEALRSLQQRSLLEIVSTPQHPYPALNENRRLGARRNAGSHLEQGTVSGSQNEWIAVGGQHQDSGEPITKHTWSRQDKSAKENAGDFTLQNFTLQNVVTEFLTNKLIELLCQELALPNPDNIQYFHRYGLVNAQAKEYIRATQRRLLLEPLAQCLSARWGNSQVETYLNQILQTLCTTAPTSRGFAAANLVHLKLALGFELTGQNFSHLQIREADLRGVSLAQLNLTHADLTGTVFTEIFNAVLTVAFSPDGQTLAVAGTDGTVSVWHVATKQLIGTCPGNGRWIWAVAFSPNGEFLATGCADRLVRIWQIAAPDGGFDNAAERQVYRVLAGHTDAIFAVSFHPNSQQLATASADGTIRIWHCPSGEPLQTLRGHTAVNDVVYSPDGQLLASGGRDGDVRLWRVADGQSLWILQGHQDEVTAVAFHPDGCFLATAGSDQAIHLWHTESGEYVRTLRSNTSELLCIAFHPDGHTLAVNERNYAICLWSTESGRIVRTLRGHSSTVHSFAFSADGQTLVSGSWDRTIRFWDTRNGDALHTIQGYRNDIASIALTDGSSDSIRYLANGNTDGQITLWDVDAGKQLQTLKGHTRAVHTVAFHPSGRCLASGSADQTIRLWPIDKRQRSSVRTLWGHTDEVTAVVFSPDGDFFASAGADQLIRIWHTETGETRHILRSHTCGINALGFCPATTHKSLLLVSSDDESNLYGWEITQPQASEDLVEHSRPHCVLTKVPANGIQALAFSQDGSVLAAGGAESVIQLWSMPDCRPLHTLQGHTSSIYGLSFNPDGRSLASGSGDQTIMLWDLQTGQQQRILRGHKNVVKAVLFHPDGQRLISSSSDETIKIWGIESGECLQTLQPARPYAGMDITGATGITQAQKATLKALGAVEDGR